MVVEAASSGTMSTLERFFVRLKGDRPVTLTLAEMTDDVVAAVAFQARAYGILRSTGWRRRPRLRSRDEKNGPQAHADERESDSVLTRVNPRSTA